MVYIRKWLRICTEHFIYFFYIYILNNPILNWCHHLGDASGPYETRLIFVQQAQDASSELSHAVYVTGTHEDDIPKCFDQQMPALSQIQDMKVHL